MSIIRLHRNLPVKITEESADFCIAEAQIDCTHTFVRSLENRNKVQSILNSMRKHAVRAFTMAVTTDSLKSQAVVVSDVRRPTQFIDRPKLVARIESEIDTQRTEAEKILRITKALTNITLQESEDFALAELPEILDANTVDALMKALTFTMNWQEHPNIILLYDDANVIHRVSERETFKGWHTDAPRAEHLSAIFTLQSKKWSTGFYGTPQKITQ